MVTDLFAGMETVRPNGEDSRSVSVASSGNRAVRRRPSGRRGGPDQLNVRSAEDRRLFVECVEQVQRQLKSNVGSPSTLHTLASYYTRIEPEVEGRPFCVTLSYATFLFHMQMARVSEGDVHLYVQLVAAVLAQIPDDQRLTHPFIQRVVRDAIYGLPSPTCVGGAHCVALVPPLQYRAFAQLAASLAELGVVPVDVLYQWQDKLEALCGVSSPLIANRALTLLVRTVSSVRVDEQVSALQYVLRSKAQKINVDFLLACYERLRRAVPDPSGGASYGRALSIHCSELFLRFRSPIRRDYVEHFLFPSLSATDMQGLLQIPATRQHLCGELLRQCTPGMTPTNPYYLCLCAILQSSFNDEMEGAVEVVELIHCQMPHAAYFMATLAVDSHMSVSMFAKVMIALARGAGLAMTGRDARDDVAAALQNRTNVYNVLFLLREVVRSCSITASRRATDMLKALRVAVPTKTIETLGRLALEAFADENEEDTLDSTTGASAHPQLLCAEIAMVLHQLHIEEAMDAAIAHLKDASAVCIFCGAGRGASALCDVNGTMHMTGLHAVGRVLSTLAECAGSASVEGKLVQLLRSPSTQMDNGVHFLLFHILSNAGQHRHALFVAVEPYIRSTLTAVSSGDRVSPVGLVSSEQKANVLMLHVKLVSLLAGAIDPSYLESILKVFCEIRLRNNHDALALWYMGNLLLRNCKGNVELLPTDPADSNYCVDFPNCAPTCRTTADNAQLVLKILDRAHGFSSEMRKLVGCCVCKLIQDFNVQAPNIIGTLLSSFGFVPVGLHSLSEFALPIGASSTFWSFFLHQMKTSAPARTAFITALAKSMSQRFRITTPADAITTKGADATGHLFAVMMYEAMKRNPPLARVVLHMISQWVKQPQHPPGRYVCLVYICVQLVTVVATRGIGSEAVEMEAETRQDAGQFADAVGKAARVVRGQLPRLAKLAPFVKEENPQFYQLLYRLHGKAARAVKEVTGETCDEDASVFDRTAAEFSTSVVPPQPSEANSSAHFGATANTSVSASAYSLDIAPQADDDAIFDNHDEDDYSAYANTHVNTTTNTTTTIANNNTNHNHSISSISLSSLHHQNTNQSYTSAMGAKRAEDMNVSQTVSEAPSAILVSPHTSGRQDRSVGTSPTTSNASRRGARRQREVSFLEVDPDDSQPPPQAKEEVARAVPIAAGLRSESRGVQTSPLERLQFYESHTTRSTASAKAAVPTTPIARTPLPSRRSDTTAGGDSVWREPEMSDDFVNGDETPIADPALPALQATHAHPHVDGVAVPSGMVLDYLRAHQGSISLLHELQQFERELLAAQSAGVSVGAANHYHAPHTTPLPLAMGNAAVAPPHTTILPVTMEGRANNYSMPHSERSQAPSKTVLARLNMIQTVDRTTQLEVRTAAERQAQAHEAQRGADDSVGSSSKRRRVEEGEEGRPTPHTPGNAVGGAQFFMQQNVTSVMKDLGAMHQQCEAMAAVSGVEGMDSVVGNTPATTPFGQVILPQCFVEQKNDTAVREIRQVMGSHNPNDGRLSTSGKRKIRGSGTETADAENSSAWWTEVSSAPMPRYAADPQYSMELF